MIQQQVRHMRRRCGFTLIELLVVLILMGLAALLVAPALLPPHRDHSALDALLSSTREVAARRGQVVYLHIDPIRQWRMVAGANPRKGTLLTRRVRTLCAAPVASMESPVVGLAF